MINHDDLEEPSVQKIILTHLRDGIEVHIAFREELPVISGISGRDTNNSFDFALYDDKVVTDVFTQPGRYFGRKSSQPDEVAKYLNSYTLIQHSSHLAVIKDERVVLATENWQQTAETEPFSTVLTVHSARSPVKHTEKKPRWNTGAF